MASTDLSVNLDFLISGTSVFGTSGADLFSGLLGMGGALKLLGGDDAAWVGGLGATVDAGEGRDRVVVVGSGPVLVLDGSGADYVQGGSAGSVRAAIDGVADHYDVLGKITYGAASTDLYIIGSQVYSLEVGNDVINPGALVIGGSGNDTIVGIERIQGGIGNDVLSPLKYAEGGVGNDMLLADSDGRVELRGEAGDDTLIFYTSATVSGGAGDDTFVFKNAVQVTIGDLSAGDHIDLSDLLDVNVREAYAGGYLKETISGGYTHLWLDQDGAGDHYFELATFKGQHIDLSGFLIV